MEVRCERFAGEIEGAQEVAQFLFTARRTDVACKPNHVFQGVGVRMQDVEFLLREVADLEVAAFVAPSCQRRLFKD